MNAYELLYDLDGNIDSDANTALSGADRWSSDYEKSEFKPAKSRKTFSRKRGKAPQQFNGIHRRRAKKIRW